MRQPPKHIPPWFRCDTCGLNREGHDRLNARVAPRYRHDWATALQHARSVAHRRANTPLPDTNPKE